jgi:hypothetical protein
MPHSHMACRGDQTGYVTAENLHYVRCQTSVTAAFHRRHKGRRLFGLPAGQVPTSAEKSVRKSF